MSRKFLIFSALWVFLCICPVCEAYEGLAYEQKHTSAPHSIHILTVDPHQWKIVLARALDMGVGRESVASLAERHGALAGVNGGFFSISDSSYDGIPRGILKIEGHWFGLPFKPRGAMGWSGDGKKVLFDRILAQAFAEINGHRISINGFNQPRLEEAVVLFSSDFGKTTLTNPDCKEVIIESGHIKKVRQQGSSSIPAEGWVLSIPKKGTKGLFVEESTATMHFQILPQEHTLENAQEWEAMDYIVGGCPLLIHQGKRITCFDEEKTLSSFITLPHARTAVGIREDGKWVFVVVDGKQPQNSIGMTIEELSKLMESLGCLYALNLDGGGSSTMVFDSKIVNQPTGDEDQGNHQQRVRKVSDAILIVQK